MSLTWNKNVEKLVVLVGVAMKKGADIFPWRVPAGCQFVAMNVSDEYGKRYDLEVSSVEGFESSTIYKPSLGEYIDFDAPKVGDWVEVLNPKVSVESDEYGKRKIRVTSGLQINRIIRKVAGKSARVPAAGRRRRSAV